MDLLLEGMTMCEGCERKSTISHGIRGQSSGSSLGENASHLCRGQIAVDGDDAPQFTQHQRGRARLDHKSGWVLK
jgi:hypothetical protein